MAAACSGGSARRSSSAEVNAMSNLLLFVLVLCGGAMVAIQPSINARLAQKIGFIESASISFAVGTIALLLVAGAVGRGDWRGLQQAQWWEWTGGLFGAFFVAVTILAVPRIGTAATMAIAIAAQLTTGLILDHFGLFGYRGVPFDGRRLLGIALLLGGAWLLLRR
jgi:bacterial/archaeal transporter family-2 protein